MRTRAVLALTALACAALAACGSSGSSVVRPPTGPVPTTSTSSAPVTSAPAATSSAASSGAAAGTQRLTIQPATGLKARQVVQLHASGFSPNEQLQAVECADKGKATGPGDCNLLGMLALVSDASGTVSASLPVERGPFGANKIVCGSPVRCLVSVTQASLSPTQEADAPIAFAAP